MVGGSQEKKEFKVGPIHPPAFTIELVDVKNAPLSGVSCTVAFDGNEEVKETDDSGKIATLRPKKTVKITLK